MVPSFFVHGIALIVLAVAIFLSVESGSFVRDKDWHKAVLSGTLSIVLAIVSSASFVGGYLIYVAENTPK